MANAHHDHQHPNRNEADKRKQKSPGTDYYQEWHQSQAKKRQSKQPNKPNLSAGSVLSQLNQITLALKKKRHTDQQYSHHHEYQARITRIGIVHQAEP
jgi:hypothetical protein